MNWRDKEDEGLTSEDIDAMIKDGHGVITRGPYPSYPADPSDGLLARESLRRSLTDPIHKARVYTVLNYCEALARDTRGHGLSEEEAARTKGVASVALVVADMDPVTGKIEPAK